MTSADDKGHDGEVEFFDSLAELDEHRDGEQRSERARREGEKEYDEEGVEIIDEEDLDEEELAEFRAFEAAQQAELPSGERLQKVMAAAGVASRRVCEDLIAAGRVTVNGERVVEPGRRIDPLVDRVAVDGVAVQLDTSRRYLMLNKPRGVVSSLKDEHGRPDLSEFTERFEERLFNVGRLDYETSGLLLLTNDGELAQVLSHPSFGVEKTYVAKVRGEMTAATIGRLLRGIELEDGFIQADDARVVGVQGGSTMVEIVLHSGRNRIVRRMLEEVGHPVIELVRRQFGPLHLGTLKLGRTRELTSVEMNQLLTLARTPESAGKRRAKVRGGAAQRGVPVSREERPRRDAPRRGRDERERDARVAREERDRERRDDRRGPRREERGGASGRRDGAPRRDDRGFGRSDGGPRREDRGFGRGDERGFGRSDGGPRRDDRGFGRSDERRDGGQRRDDRGFGRSDDRGPRRDDRGYGRSDDRRDGGPRRGDGPRGGGPRRDPGPRGNGGPRRDGGPRGDGGRQR